MFQCFIIMFASLALDDDFGLVHGHRSLVMYDYDMASPRSESEHHILLVLCSSFYVFDETFDFWRATI